MDNYYQIGQRIRQARKLCGLNQSDIADVLGVETATVSKYEEGLRKIKIPQINKIAERLNITSEFIINGTLESNRHKSLQDHIRLHNISIDLLASKLKITGKFLRAIFDGQISPTQELTREIFRMMGLSDQSENYIQKKEAALIKRGIVMEPLAPYGDDRLSKLERKCNELTVDMGMIKEILLGIKNDIERHKVSVPECFGVQKKNINHPAHDHG